MASVSTTGMSGFTNFIDWSRDPLDEGSDER